MLTIKPKQEFFFAFSEIITNKMSVDSLMCKYFTLFIRGSNLNS